MNKIKFFILTIIICIIIGCSHKIIDNGNTQYFNDMHNSLNTYYTQYQVDSMINVDNLPILTDWQNLYGRDDESKDIINLYFYIKQDSLSEILYKIETIENNKYKIIKRESYK